MRLLLILWIVALTLAGMIEIPAAFISIALRYFQIETFFDMVLKGPCILLGALAATNLAATVGIGLLKLEGWAYDTED